jgi:transposase
MLSAMAGVTWWNFYFRLLPAAIRSLQVVEFRDHLQRHLAGRLLIVWNYGREQRGRIWLEFLPAYVPEPNPVEYLWSHWKQYELPNFCPHNF